MQEAILNAARFLVDNRPNVALTGAVISVDSGIPDFRFRGGLWERFDPMEYATIDAFRANPEKVWTMLLEMDELVARADPNPAHLALAELEKLGLISGIVTQNIDGLHQKAGSKNVVEFHGNAERLVCLRGCGQWEADTFRSAQSSPEIPRCRECNGLLKPDVVFFGEPIPGQAMAESFKLVTRCSAMLVVGTSATVAPASHLPLLAMERGAKVYEFNLERTVLSSLATASFEGNGSDTLTRLVESARTLTG
jgi:NAD-dependent deacetylase